MNHCMKESHRTHVSFCRTHMSSRRTPVVAKQQKTVTSIYHPNRINLNRIGALGQRTY